MNQGKKSGSNDIVSLIAAGAGLFIAGAAVYNHLTRYRLQGKVVLVTGGSRGLGLELSRQLAARGAKLAICARTEDQLERARAELSAHGAEVIAIRADLTDRTQVQSVVEEVVNHFGCIDVLINNAGIVQVGPQEAMQVEDFEVAMNINFWAALYGIYAVLPHFSRQGGGRIINVTSIGGKIAVPHLLPYTASKFALVGLSEGMRAELGSKGIIVTTVVPNLMRTGSPRNVTVKGDHRREYAWFKIADSSPVTSQDLPVAANSIIHALEQGKAEEVLTLTAKIATVVKGFAPSWVSNIMSLVNSFLPENTPGGTQARKGSESESAATAALASSSDRAAVANNEL